ncbi:putative serine kinase|nr:putative serine kinase [Candidatus Pantoea persica]
MTSVRVLTQLGISGQEIDLATLRSDRFAAQLAEHRGAVVIDAEREEDIARILAAAVQLEETPLLVGAAGLSDVLGKQLARVSGEPESDAPSDERVAAPVLAVIGSMSASAQQQIARLAAACEIALVDVDVR